jgi:tetratricopeptide (TPR) repeat protein
VRIGTYEVLGELGRGGMGVVYRVRGPTGEEAALKLLSVATPEAFARFERERRLLASLGEAQGFVSLRDAGVASPGCWLVMDLMPGGTLRARLDRGPLGIEETIALGIDLASALGAAHERGIVHRDVKPENVLFTASGRPLLTDLGLAKHFDRGTPGASQSMSLTGHGTVKGTVGYMGPEQISDPASAGPASDVFALGALLYECLAGRPAFEGTSVVELLARANAGVVEPVGPRVPRWLAAVIGRALAADPRDRFRDGRALAQALRQRERAAPARPRAALLLGLAAALALAGAAVAISWPRAPLPAPVVRPRVPAPAPSAPPSAAEEFRKHGLEKEDRDDFPGAIADFTRAIELDPRDAEAWMNRGAARGRLGQLDEAIADMDRAIALRPDFALAYQNRGVSRGMKGDHAGAIDDYTRAIELMPRLAQAWGARGIERGAGDDHEGAIADLTRAIEIAPDVAHLWGSRGVQRGTTGDWEGEIADLTRAIQLAPRVALNYASRGLARGKTRDWKGQVADETRAIELDPRLALAWHRRGAGRAMLEDYEGSIVDDSRAIELDPRLSDAWASRGASRTRTGDVAGAISDIEQFLVLDPESPRARSLREKLQELRKRPR